MSRETTRQAQSVRDLAVGWSQGAADRLRTASKAFGTSFNKTQAEIAEMVPMARTRLVGVLSGKITPSMVQLGLICDTLGVDIDEIIGDGGKRSFSPPNYSQPLHGDVRVGDEEFSVITRHEVNVSAGPGLMPISESTSGGIAFARSWLIQRGIAADMAGLVSVRGDSMAPTIPDGATVLVQIVVPTIEREAIYVYSRNGQAFMKRLNPTSFGLDGRPNSIEIKSDNPAYKTELVTGRDLNDIRVIGRVRSVVSDV